MCVINEFTAPEKMQYPNAVHTDKIMNAKHLLSL